MTISKKNALGAANTEGNVRNQPARKELTTMETIPDATQTERISELFDEIDACPPGRIIVLTPDDDLYEEPVETELLRASELVDADGIATDLAAGTHERYFFGKVCRLDGSRVPVEERTEQWWDDNPMTGASPRFQPNAVARLGTDYLLVSRGEWVVTGQTAAPDGETMFEFTAYPVWAEQEHRQALEAERRELQEFLDEHPQVAALSPSWATDIDMFGGDEEIELTYQADFGSIGVFTTGTYFKASDEFTVAPAKFSLDGLDDAGLDALTEIIASLPTELAQARAAVQVTR